MAQVQEPQIRTLGIAPVFADATIYALQVVVGHAVIRMVVGPAWGGTHWPSGPPVRERTALPATHLKQWASLPIATQFAWRVNGPHGRDSKSKTAPFAMTAKGWGTQAHFERERPTTRRRKKLKVESSKRGKKGGPEVRPYSKGGDAAGLPAGPEGVL
jgi:hypothetical protein